MKDEYLYHSKIIMLWSYFKGHLENQIKYLTTEEQTKPSCNIAYGNLTNVLLDSRCHVLLRFSSINTIAGISIITTIAWNFVYDNSGSSAQSVTTVGTFPTHLKHITAIARTKPSRSLSIILHIILCFMSLGIFSCLFFCGLQTTLGWSHLNIIHSAVSSR